MPRSKLIYKIDKYYIKMEVNMPCGCTENKDLNKNIGNTLSLGTMRNTSIDEIINLYRQGYKLEESSRYVSQDIFVAQTTISGNIQSLATRAYPNIKVATARYNGSSTIPMILYGNSGTNNYVHLEAYVAPSTMISEIRECASVMTTLWRLAIFPAVSGAIYNIMFRARGCNTDAAETCTTCAAESLVSSWLNSVSPGANNTTAPPTPTGLTITPGDSSLTLSWNIVNDPGGSGEVFAYKVTVNPGGITGYRGPGTDKTVTISGLTNGISYTASVKSLSHNNVESSGAATGSGTPTVPLTLDSIEISPMSASINVGIALQMTATCRDQFGATMTCPTISWSSSNSAIASVNPLTGLTTTVTGVAAGGPVNITASGGGRSGNATVTVMTIVGTITFNVTSAGSPLSGVEISVDGTPRGMTDVTGTFLAQSLTIGATHTYTATKPGYNTVSDSIVLSTTAITVPISMTTPANITATSITGTPSDPCMFGSCSVSVSIRWTNNGQATGAIVPNITIDGLAAEPIPSSVDMIGGAILDRVFIVTGLIAGSHNICPSPA